MDLLIELFSEEIPARMQGKASEDLKRLVTDGLVEAGLTYGSAAAFATPRRLALSVEGLTAESRAVREERKGPAVTAPAAAVEGFLRSTGLTLDQLEVRDEKKGQAYYAVVTKPGRAAAAVVAEVLEAAVRGFPWPKSMRWGSGNLRWVRPLHSIVCILSSEAGAEVVPLEIDGIVAGNVTRGHRFMAPKPFSVNNFEDYEAKLKRAFVVLRSDERAATIWHDATTAAFALGLEVVEDKGLLAEVAGLVEWPVVLMGAIGAQFLDLPPEVLQTSMREHQKFFSVRSRSGRIERFVTVANIESPDQGATILAGNGKVLAARLSDAKFFYDNDLRVARAGMGEWVEGLKAVTFHNKLGSQFDRVERIAALAREIAPMVGADPELAEQAARVAKADLRSAMVGEFPELQGLMGRYYSEAAGFAPEVAAACEEHYSPLGPADAVPARLVSVAVALADRIDTLCGFWAIDEKPTGSKDPFALRRAALGVIRLVVGNERRIKLIDCFNLAVLTHLKRIGSNLSLVKSQEVLDDQFDFADEFSRWGAFGHQLQSIGIDLASNISLIERIDFQVPDQSVFVDHYLSEVVTWNPLEKPYFIRQAEQEYEKYSKLLQLNNEMEVMWGYHSPKDYPKQTFDQTVIGAVGPTLRKLTGSISSDLLAFFHDRLKVFLKDQGIRHDIIDACIAPLPLAATSAAGPGNDDLTLLVKRAEALSAFLKTDDGENLLQGFKRANNILSQAEAKDGVEYSYGADIKFAENDAERQLFNALDAADATIKPAMDTENFGQAMTAMAALRAPIDAFFTAVQVNDANPVLRRNRLNLLHRIRTICLSVADLTKIDG